MTETERADGYLYLLQELRGKINLTVRDCERWLLQASENSCDERLVQERILDSLEKLNKLALSARK